MKDEHKIIRQVYAAKEDMAEADALIRTYMPFIRAETARWLKRPPAEGQDDELSIAMIAFHEAVRGYSRTKGAFFKYAAMLIRSRLIDYHRREERHRGSLSLDEPEGGERGDAGGEAVGGQRPQRGAGSAGGCSRRDCGADPSDAGLRRGTGGCGGELSQTAEDLGGLPKGDFLCQGESGAFGGISSD